MNESESKAIPNDRMTGDEDKGEGASWETESNTNWIAAEHVEDVEEHDTVALLTFESDFFSECMTWKASF